MSFASATDSNSSALSNTPSHFLALAMSRYSTRSALGDVTNRGAYKVAGGKAGAPLAKVGAPRRAARPPAFERATFAACTAALTGRARPATQASKLDLHRVAEPKRAVNVDSVDRPDVSNAQACVPYLEEIHRHYRETEARAPATPRDPAGVPRSARPRPRAPAARARRAAPARRRRRAPRRRRAARRRAPAPRNR